MILFIDTDVILDTLLVREPHFNYSADILALADKYKCCTSVHSLINIHYFTKRKFGEEAARKTIEVLTKKLTVVSENIDIIYNAIDSTIPYFEDAVQVYAAKNAGVEAIVTRNIRDYEQSEIPVYTPQQFLKNII